MAFTGELAKIIDANSTKASPESQWRGLSSPLDEVGTQPTVDEISTDVQQNMDVANRTDFGFHEINAAWNNIQPVRERSKRSTGQLIGNRLSDQLWNNTIGGLITMTSGRDGSYIEDRAFQLVLKYEKDNGFKFTDALFEDQLGDWTRQLMQPPEFRNSPELKNEPQLVPFNSPESILGPRDLETTDNKWVDGAIDLGTGLLAFGSKVKALKAAIPNASAPVVWEAVSIANGGRPGEVSSIYGALGLLNKVIPGSFEVLFGKPLPGGALTAKIASGVTAGAVFGTTTAIAGGSTEEIILNTGFPIFLSFMTITRQDWQNAKPKSKLQVARELRMANPELAFESSAKIIKAMSDALPEGTPLTAEGRPGKPKSAKKLVAETRLKQLESQKAALADKTRTAKLPPQELSARIKASTELSKQIQATKVEAGLAPKPVESKGKTKVSKQALSVEENAIFKKIVGEEGIEGKPEFQVSNQKEQARRALKLRQTNPEKALRIATLEERPPSDILANSVFAAVERHALMTGDGVTLRKLATSPFSAALTRAGQEISMAGTRERYSPVGNIEDIITVRRGISDKKFNKKLDKAKKSLDKAETRVIEKDIDTTIKNISTPKITKKRVDITAKKYGRNNTLVTRVEYDGILAELAKEKGALPGKQVKGVRKGGVFIPSTKDFARLSKLATFHIEAMGRNFGEWSRVLKNQLGDWVVPHLQKLWNETSASFGKREGELAAAKISNGINAGKSLDKMSVEIQKLAESFVAQGIKKRGPLVDAVHKVLIQVEPDITKRQTMDAISGFGKFKRLNPDEIKTELRDIKGQLQQVAKLQDMQKGIAPAKTGVERRTPSQEERNLIKQVNEAKKKGGFIVADPERQLKTSLDTIKTRLRNRISDLELQIKTREKIVKTKTEQPSDVETKALTKQKDALQKQFDEIFTKPKMTDEQRINAALKATEKSIIELERRIKTGDIEPKKKGEGPTSPELEAARSRRDALKADIKTMKDSLNPKRTPEEIRLQSFKTRLKNEAAKLNEKIADGDFVKKPVTPIKLDLEAQGLKHARDTAKRVMRAAQEVVDSKDRISAEEVNTLTTLSSLIEERQLAVDKDPLNKTKHIALGNAMLDFEEFTMKLAPRQNTYRTILLDVAGLPTTIMTSIDFSFPFRQGWASMTTPEFWQGFQKQFGYAWNEVNFRNLMAEIKGSPDFARAKKAGLRMPDLGAQLELRAEGMQSTLGDRIPIAGRYIRASQRAYTGMANYIRWNRFNKLMNSAELMGLDVKIGGRLSKDIADIVNITTGSGGLGSQYDRRTGELITTDRFGNITPAANQLLFSIRKISADVSMINPAKYIKLSPFARKQMIKQAVGSLAITTTILGLAKMAGIEVETDVRSSDFGKLKIGETRIDISGGKISMLVFLARVGPNLIPGLDAKTTLSTGKTIELDQDGPFDPSTLKIVTQYSRGKLAPMAGLFAELVIFHSDFKGDPTETPGEIGKAVAQRFYPMNISDIVDLLEDDAFGNVFADALFDIFAASLATTGASVNTYDVDKDK